MINYYCPGFVESQLAYKKLFWLRDNAPQCFNEGVCIKKIYGCFPNMIWNGGSYWFSNGMSRNTIIDYFNWYSTQNVELQLTFTNPILTENDVYDRYGNAVLEIASKYDFVEVLVASEILEKYIREKYPHMKIDRSIISTTRDRENSDQDNFNNYIENFDKYNMCVLPRKYGKDFDFLNNIPKEYRNRFEILATDPCPINCPRLYSHYEDMAKAQLWIEGGEECSQCTAFNPKNPFRQWTYRNQRIPQEDLIKYDELGFTEIKISGRVDLHQMIITTVPYLIKPEYQIDVYFMLFDNFKGQFIQPDFS